MAAQDMIKNAASLPCRRKARALHRYENVPLYSRGEFGGDGLEAIWKRGGGW
jgi:hypothetical protein